MIKLNEQDIILDSSEIDSEESIFVDTNKLNINDIKNVKRFLKKKNKYSFKLFRITFFNDFKYNCKLIKILLNLFKSEFSFGVSYKNYNLFGIVTFNCDEEMKLDLENALKAVFIKDNFQRINFLYDTIFASLDDLWKRVNPCDFCDDRCISSRNNCSAHEKNGCCYSFNYSTNPFKLIDNVKVCKYLGNNKHCTTNNISCKLFVCKYLRRKKIFNIDIKNIFLIQAFFDRKKQLVLRQNYFRSKEEIIEKLLIDYSKVPYILYYLQDYYRIYEKN